MSFEQLGLGPNILKAVARAGYTVPTPIQLAAIPVILDGKDLIGIAQTGTGKTAAFVLPMLEMLAKENRGHGKRHPAALILAPTRELAAQIDEAVKMLCADTPFTAVTIYGGVNDQPQIDAVRRGVDIVVATPGRLLDLMQSGYVSLKEIRYAVLDEADRMLDMGFLPQIRRVVNALPRDRQTMLFSATLSPQIEQITASFLHQPEMVQIGRRSNPADTVAQYLYPVTKAKKVDLLLHLLTDLKLDTVLIFSRTKHGADKIARKLKHANITTATIHANRTQRQRESALKHFKEGAVRVLVATDIAARGIDVEGISHVINFDFPMNPEDYVHRIGRTGRAEAVGDAISFVGLEDGPYVHALEKMIGRKLDRMMAEGFDYGDTALMLAVPTQAEQDAQKAGTARPMPKFGSRNRTTRSRMW
jgi:ATP-dependent RNA helicase RhlE